MSELKVAASADAKDLKISIIGLGAPVLNVVIKEGETLEVALVKGGLDTAGMDIRVNSEVATPATVLKEDAVVTAMPHVEGGY